MANGSGGVWSGVVRFGWVWCGLANGLGLVRCGRAWQGRVWCGAVRLGLANGLGKVGYGGVGRGLAWRGKARLMVEARFSLAWYC